jgi:hypothetical protein
MTKFPMTPRDRKILAWIVLVVGAISTLGGLFGVWLQGLFYRGGFPTAATFGEVRCAFTWPTAFTIFGCLTVASVVFASPITVSWAPRRRLVAFVSFAVLVLFACAVCGHLAAARVAGILN